MSEAGFQVYPETSNRHVSGLVRDIVVKLEQDLQCSLSTSQHKLLRATPFAFSNYDRCATRALP